MIKINGNRIVDNQIKLCMLKRVDFDGVEYIGDLKDGIYRSQSAVNSKVYAYLIVDTYKQFTTIVGVSGMNGLEPLSSDSHDKWFCDWEYCPNLEIEINIKEKR